MEGIVEQAISANAYLQLAIGDIRRAQVAELSDFMRQVALVVWTGGVGRSGELNRRMHEEGR